MAVILKSLPYFREVKSFFLYFIILPLLQAILFVCIIQDYTTGVDKNIMTASIILSSASMTLQMISSIFVGDINRGIDRLIAVEFPYSIYYWGNRFIVCFFGSYLLVIINGLLLGHLQLVSFEQIVYIAPICIVSGFIIGLCGTFISWGYKNVYFWTNVLGQCIVLFSGALGSISNYPPVFRWFGNVFPFGKILEEVHGNTIDLMGIIINLVIWCMVTVTIYVYRVKTIVNEKTTGFF